MSAQPLTAAEAARVAEIDAAADAEESLRERVAAVLTEHRRKKDHLCSCGWVDMSVPLSVTWEQHAADAAIAAICEPVR